MVLIDTLPDVLAALAIVVIMVAIGVWTAPP